jgi:DNA-binding MarR family transcriptional regulator
MQARNKARQEPRAAHRELVDRVATDVRRMGAQSVLTSRMIADRFGLNDTDLEVLDLIFLREQASAGDLAAATGLTSGAVTALIDRLVDAGYVERRADPADRRKVLVRIRHAAIRPIKEIFDGMERRMVDLWSSFSARDLAVISDFLARSTDEWVEACKGLREAAPRPKQRRGRGNR